MLYPLYDFYSNSFLSLLEIKNHFLEHFYYQDHSGNEAKNVLKSVVTSSKINRLLRESYTRGIAPTYTDFLSTICGMWKFMFKSNDTIVLATIDAAIYWDIEVNDKLHLLSQEELRQEILKVFAKYQVYKPMTEEEFNNPPEPMEHPVLKTWDIDTFSSKFGSMKVEEYVNTDTGESFHSCVFTNGYTRTFVSFSSKVGELTDEEITDRKDELSILQLPNGKYKMIKKNKE